MRIRRPSQTCLLDFLIFRLVPLMFAFAAVLPQVSQLTRHARVRCGIAQFLSAHPAVRLSLRSSVRLGLARPQPREILLASRPVQLGHPRVRRRFRRCPMDRQQIKLDRSRLRRLFRLFSGRATEADVACAWQFRLSTRSRQSDTPMLKKLLAGRTWANSALLTKLPLVPHRRRLLQS